MKRTLAVLRNWILAGGSPRAKSGLVHEERSLNRNICVAENGGERVLYFRGRADSRQRVGQSCIDVDKPDLLVSESSRMMMAGLYVQPLPQRILMIGLGGGVVPRTFQQLLPDAEMDVVEIDPAVIRVAETHFGFRPSSRTRLHEADGRVFVKQHLAAGAKYDLVMLDAYDEEYIPEHLLTVEFLSEVGGLLTPEGAVVANTWASSRLYDRESETYETAFGPFLNFKSRRNRIVVAGPASGQPRGRMEANAEEWEARLAYFGVTKDDLLPMLQPDRDWNLGAAVLTDQCSPWNPLN